MAKSIVREISAQETTIHQDLASQYENCTLESRYECPICINWLNEPVLTKCGHRFCNKCITDWLEKGNANCPIDNKQLLYGSDIFPDNFTRREIQQIKKQCPNLMSGCKSNLSPIEMDAHILECEFQKRTISYACPFNRCGCKFTSTDESGVKTHVDKEFQEHLNLLMTTMTQNNDMKSLNLWDPPNKNQTNSNSELVRVMYERIVVLEQENRMQGTKIDKLERQFNKYGGGVLVWRITQFRSKIDAMLSNPNMMFYSTEAYTSPHGYKFCGRINIPHKTKDSIGLHIHLMQSENDYHLDWPFKGRIKISMIHSRNSESHHDTIMSKPEILAFHCPTQEVSPRGFGYLEYASVTDILRRGFVVDDTLSIKIQMNIV